MKNAENLNESQNHNLLLGDVISRFNSDTFIDNVCLSYRHDFGLMAEQDKQRLRFECKEWMRAISNNWEYFKNGINGSQIGDVADLQSRKLSTTAELDLKK